MALIAEIHQPKVAMVPIGDRFTMGPATAAMAVKRFLKVETVIPCHYGSFPIIEPNADKFVAEMKGDTTKVIVPEKGKPFTRVRPPQLRFTKDKRRARRRVSPNHALLSRGQCHGARARATPDIRVGQRLGGIRDGGDAGCHEGRSLRAVAPTATLRRKPSPTAPAPASCRGAGSLRRPTS